MKAACQEGGTQGTSPVVMSSHHVCFENSLDSFGLHLAKGLGIQRGDPVSCTEGSYGRLQPLF